MEDLGREYMQNDHWNNERRYIVENGELKCDKNV